MNVAPWKDRVAVSGKTSSLDEVVVPSPDQVPNRDRATTTGHRSAAQKGQYSRADVEHLGLAVRGERWGVDGLGRRLGGPDADLVQRLRRDRGRRTDHIGRVRGGARGRRCLVRALADPGDLGHDQGDRDEEDQRDGTAGEQEVAAATRLGGLLLGSPVARGGPAGGALCHAVNSLTRAESQTRSAARRALSANISASARAIRLETLSPGR